MGGIFGMSWGDVWTTVATVGIDAGVTALTGGAGIGLAPLVSTLVGAAAGGATTAIGDAINGQSTDSAIESGLETFGLGGIGGGILGKIGKTFLGGAASKLSGVTASGIAKFGFGGLGITKLSSIAGEGVVDWFMDRNKMPSTLPTKAAGPISA